MVIAIHSQAFTQQQSWGQPRAPTQGPSGLPPRGSSSTGLFWIFFLRRLAAALELEAPPSELHLRSLQCPRPAPPAAAAARQGFLRRPASSHFPLRISERPRRRRCRRASKRTAAPAASDRLRWPRSSLRSSRVRTSGSRARWRLSIAAALVLRRCETAGARMAASGSS